MIRSISCFLFRPKVQRFTLVELLVVIVVIGILAAIAIPNISQFQSESKQAAILSDGRNIQTATDAYQLKNFGSLPILEDESPKIGMPRSVDFSKLKGTYLRKPPSYGGVYFQIDYSGRVYHSLLDSPNDFEQGVSGLSWTPDEKAASYSIYQLLKPVSGAVSSEHVRLLGTIDGGEGSYTPKHYNQDSTYLISGIDLYGFESAPVVEGYQGSSPYIPSLPNVEDALVDSDVPAYRQFIDADASLVVSNAQGNQVFPLISSDGRYAAWLDSRQGSFYDIYWKDLLQGRESTLSQSKRREHASLSSNGRYLVWGEYSANPSPNPYQTNKDLYGKDLWEDREFLVSDSLYPQERPSISSDGRYVVWTEYRNSSVSKLYGKDLSTDVEFLVSDRQGSLTSTSISSDGRYVLFRQSLSGSYLLYRKDLVTNEEVRVSPYSTYQSQPYMTEDGRFVLWVDNRNGGNKLYGKDFVENREFLISDHPSQKESPSISTDGRYVVWSDRRDGNDDYNIYGKDLATDKEFVVSNAPSNQTNPRISADGNLVIYMTKELDGTNDILLKDISKVKLD